MRATSLLFYLCFYVGGMQEPIWANLGLSQPLDKRGKIYKAHTRLYAFVCAVDDVVSGLRPRETKVSPAPPQNSSKTKKQRVKRRAP